MLATRRAILGAGVYLGLALASLAYELSIRLYDRGNSEFAGMLSAFFTLPSSLIMFVLTPTLFGVRVGDSDAAFVTILGAAALLNAVLLFLLLNRGTKHAEPRTQNSAP
jgi:hypothetical protein